MMGRSAWPSILVVGTWLVGLEPGSCLAQPPPSAVPAAGNPAGAAPPPAPDRPGAPGGSVPGWVRAPAPPVPDAPGGGQPPTTPAGPRRAPRSPPPATPPQPVESLARFPNLPEAPTEPADLRFPINLATALRLSDAQPIVVAAAQASVWVAEAQLQRARVLWIPTLN